MASISSSIEDGSLPDQGQLNPRYLYIDQQYFWIPPPKERDYLSPPLNRQSEMLAAIMGGSDVVALVAPGNDLSRAVDIARIRGEVSPLGLAHIASDCGGIGVPSGPVQTIQPSIIKPVVGAWHLRPPGENFDVPMATNIGKHGNSIDLYCHAGIPAIASNGFGVEPPFNQTPTVRLSIDNLNFAFRAQPYNGLWIFAISQRFLDALQAGKQFRATSSTDPEAAMSLQEGDTALRHAFQNCGPAQNF